MHCLGLSDRLSAVAHYVVNEFHEALEGSRCLGAKKSIRFCIRFFFVSGSRSFLCLFIM